VCFFDCERIPRRIKTLYQAGLDESQQRADALLAVNHFALRLQAVEVSLLLAKENDRDWQSADNGVDQIRLRASRPD
jgi:hypothetical protein